MHRVLSRTPPLRVCVRVFFAHEGCPVLRDYYSGQKCAPNQMCAECARLQRLCRNVVRFCCFQQPPIHSSSPLRLPGPVAHPHKSPLNAHMARPGQAINQQQLPSILIYLTRVCVCKQLLMLYINGPLSCSLSVSLPRTFSWRKSDAPSEPRILRMKHAV